MTILLNSWTTFPTKVRDDNRFLHERLLVNYNWTVNTVICEYSVLIQNDRVLIRVSELLGDLLANKPSETDAFSNVVIVDGIPQVGPERFEKLKNVITGYFAKFGTIVNDYYPKDEDNNVKGCVII